MMRENSIVDSWLDFFPEFEKETFYDIEKEKYSTLNRDVKSPLHCKEIDILTLNPINCQPLI